MMSVVLQIDLMIQINGWLYVFCLNDHLDNINRHL
ncbi:hypothetical protein DFP75_103194 [Marinomonas alcarazii]|uniref:Uncharacterized protein n=1 Tax=Marinomonas alcarazii TaxID=491949 RepID=A0A318V4J3_9GAMM|nr:hypothetical protein DFP75_103194 [Marinomonas alcarazii]